MVSYDPNVIQQHAQRLYVRANSITVLYTLSFGLLGLLGGGTVAVAMFDLAGVIAVLSAAAAAGIGFVMGQARGFELRLEAQVALCQTQIEFNTRAQPPAANHAQPNHAQPGVAYPR